MPTGVPNKKYTGEFKQKVVEYMLTNGLSHREGGIKMKLKNEMEQLEFENAQLRGVIEQMDPEFFNRKCRVCGCDWNHPCPEGCWWVEEDLCSSCAEKLELIKQRKKGRK